MKSILTAVGLALLLAINGCSIISPKVTDDLDVFVTTAQKFGTAEDIQCAVTLADQWAKLDELSNDNSGGIISFAYRGVLASRFVQAWKEQALQNCGNLIAEIMIQIGKTAMKFRP
jgi:hypothetical protein